MPTVTDLESDDSASKNTDSDDEPSADEHAVEKPSRSRFKLPADSGYNRGDEGPVRPHVREVVRRAAAIDDEQHSLRLLEAKRAYRDTHGDAVESDDAQQTLPKTLLEGASNLNALERAHLAVAASVHEAALAEAKALYADTGARQAAMSRLEGARRQGEADKAVLAALQVKQRERDVVSAVKKAEEARLDAYDRDVFMARDMQREAREMAALSNLKYLCPPATKSAGQWRETTRLAALEMAANAADAELRRGAQSFAFPSSDDEIATCTVAFFALPGTRASATGFLPSVQVDHHLVELIVKMRQALFPAEFGHSAIHAGGLLEVEDVAKELQRQGATDAMVRRNGVPFSRFASLLQWALKPRHDLPSLLPLVHSASSVSRVLPRFSDFHPVARTWLPLFGRALAKYTRSVPAHDYLGKCELNPVKAVEQLELTATEDPAKFARGALDGVQLEVSRLFKGRLLNAVEFNIACIRGSVEAVRNSPPNRAFLKAVTDPTLLVDPQHRAEQRCLIT